MTNELREKWETVRPLTDTEIRTCIPEEGDTACPFCGAKIVWCYPGVYAHCSRNPMGSVPCDCTWEGPINFDSGSLEITDLDLHRVLHATGAQWHLFPTPNGHAWAKLWTTPLSGVKVVTGLTSVLRQDSGYQVTVGVRPVPGKGSPPGFDSQIELHDVRGSVITYPALVVSVPTVEGLDEILRECVRRGDHVQKIWESRTQTAEA